MAYKERPIQATDYYLDGRVGPGPTTLAERITTFSSKLVNGHYVSDNYCEHTKALSLANYIYGGYVRPNNISQLHHVNAGEIQAKAWEQAHIGLDFQKNNSFEIIPFLMDWDSTLKLFAEKLTYGGFTWGVMPLMSDIQSVINTLSDINHGLVDSFEKVSHKKYTQRCPFSYTGNDGAFKYAVDGILTLKGHIGGEILPTDPGEAYLVFLDEIGFNPDLRTLWDIIPMSFVVDYFFPVGDFLESTHPRGWFNPTLSFDGTYSIKATISMVGAGTSHVGYGGSYSYYVRDRSIRTLPTRPMVTPNFEAPSLKEVFNTVYLAHSHLTKRKKGRF